MMRHPLALFAGLLVVAGLESWAFGVSDDPDPATVRFARGIDPVQSRIGTVRQRPRRASAAERLDETRRLHRRHERRVVLRTHRDIDHRLRFRRRQRHRERDCIKRNHKFE